jgi:hypothetical protein
MPIPYRLGICLRSYFSLVVTRLLLSNRHSESDRTVIKYLKVKNRKKNPFNCTPRSTSVQKQNSRVRSSLIIGNRKLNANSLPGICLWSCFFPDDLVHTIWIGVVIWSRCQIYIKPNSTSDFEGKSKTQNSTKLSFKIMKLSVILFYIIF